MQGFMHIYCEKLLVARNCWEWGLKRPPWSAVRTGGWKFRVPTRPPSTYNVDIYICHLYNISTNHLQFLLCDALYSAKCGVAITCHLSVTVDQDHIG